MEKKRTYRYIEKNHTSSEVDKSQDGENINSITKKKTIKKNKIEYNVTKIEYEISRRKLIQYFEEKQRIVWFFRFKRWRKSR